jgi:hypothetical protein
MGHGWKLLTGADPVAGGTFDEFVKAGYLDVGGKLPLTRTIKTVIDNVARRSPDNRFGRDFCTDYGILAADYSTYYAEGMRVVRSHPADEQDDY